MIEIPLRWFDNPLITPTMNDGHTLKRGKNILNTKILQEWDTKNTTEAMQTRFVKTHQKIERHQGDSDDRFEATVHRSKGEEKLQQVKDFVK